MGSAAQAEQLAAIAAGGASRTAPGARAAATAPFDVTVRLRVKRDSHLRRQPRARAPSIRLLAVGAQVVAHAWRDGWFKVETGDGRAAGCTRRESARRDRRR